MGRYTDLDMVKGRYPTAQKAIAQSAVSSYFIDGAEGELDARLAARYTVPFSPAPSFIRDLATDIVFYKMTIFQESSEALGKYIDSRIEGLISGTIVLPSAPTSDNNGAWVSDSYHSKFGLDNPVNWQTDADQIDATIEGRR